MSTSGGGTVNAVLYVIMLACSVRAGSVLLGGGAGQLLRRPPAAAAGLWLIVAVPSLLQIPFPGLLPRLERAPGLIRHDGQWWRLFTAGVVQDGGIVGTVFNLAVLAVVSVVAIRAWGAARALLILAAALVAFSLATTFAWPSAGAGNSAAAFALATSVTGLALVVRHQRVAVLLAAVTVASGVGLLALRDAHGAAVLGGLVIGALVSAVSPPGSVVTPARPGPCEPGEPPSAGPATPGHEPS